MMPTALKFISFISPYLSLFSLCFKAIQLLIIPYPDIQDRMVVLSIYSTNIPYVIMYNRQRLLFSLPG